MASEDADEFSTVSSIFYAIRNSPEKQKLLLNNQSAQSPKIEEKQTETSISSQLPLFEENAKSTTPIEKKEVPFRKRPLFDFYPEIPPIAEVKRPLTKRKREKKVSPTRKLLATALQETKKRIVSQQKLQVKRKTISKKEMKRKALKKIEDQTIKLNQFIPEKKVVIKAIKENDPESQEMNVTQLNLEAVLDENGPFPFTNLSEWLIWHHNYPELAFVREAYDPEQIPDEGDIEVFWVSVMNDPEFFNPEWRIAGSTIDIDSIRQRRHLDWAPEWDIMSSYTDGLSIYLEDVYQILSNYPQGLENYRYPVLQFALKGLLLLDLVHYDHQKWFKKGKREDLSRLTKLDQFISGQDNLSTYRFNLNPEKMNTDWYIGLICFDLIIIRSSFLKRFSQNQITEDEKVQVLIEEDMNQIISDRLSTIEELERLRVKNLRKKLLVG